MKDFKWPIYKNDKLNRAFVNYLVSVKDDTSSKYNLSNMMFVMGPEKMGKSWLIKYNLKMYERTNKLVCLLIVSSETTYRT